ncbi:MAG: cyclase family protein [Chloroflexi bacterium AL-W]|nr:cyclase family protein [Chloroflexi bacterium AL-N1]NOK66355.1 cyclase family protein [Chloroflexi bacterium AL-N10]NOK71743.1 cyclase family protein [Chloroflexi bacterium AL-N5]NOK81000.1 cyclase family protein [Chloroflexi bacterium AL-W]NOK89273.1 cyclase family protein [Chloroflexi bacterium AL-N15]
MHIIDLSTPIAPSSEDTPALIRTDLTYVDHTQGAGQIKEMFGVPAELLRSGEGWAIEVFTRFGTHDSTHVDAPWHYNSQTQGQRSQTIDELPLEWFFNDGVVLDMTHKADSDAMTVADAQAALDHIGYTLKPLDIVMIRTDCDRFYGQPDYLFHGCGVTAEVTHWLFDQGIRVMGIDAWGWDAPLDRQAKYALTQQQAGIFWAAHQADLPYAQIERLVNLKALPSCGFKVACFPLKVAGGSAGPTRAVALVNE